MGQRINILEKVASELEKVADYLEKIGEEVEKKEKEEKEEKEKEEKETKAKEDEDKASEETKRKDLITPIKERLSNIADDEEVESKLEGTPMEALELIKKSFEQTRSDVNWGSIEENKFSSTGGKNKLAGYRDPLEAFAMGE